MDVIITALGEFVWAASYVPSRKAVPIVFTTFSLSSCAVVNFCLSSGLSVLVVFISFLCAILASAFYKYNTTREEMSQDTDPRDEKSLPPPSSTEPLLTSPSEQIITVESNDAFTSPSLSDIEIEVEDNQESEPGEEFIVETIEGSEDEIQKQQIANIYRLLNDQHLINSWSTTDFLDQLKMYGLQTYDEDELESSDPAME